MWRHEVIRSINEIVDANSIDELFSGPHDESVKICTVLLDLASGAERHERAVEVVARRRGLTAQYIEDRAKVLLSSVEEAGRMDAYRVLGLPPLASGEAIRDRWRRLAMELHPDTRGDEAGLKRFLSIKQAYETLSDPVKREAYEKEWRRTVGVVEEARVALEASGAKPIWRKWLGSPKPREQAADEVEEESLKRLADQRWLLVVADLSSFVRRWRALEDRIAGGIGHGRRSHLYQGVSGLVTLAGLLRKALATFTLEELGGVEREVAKLLPPLERAHRGIEALREIKQIAGDRAA